MIAAGLPTHGLALARESQDWYRNAIIGAPAGYAFLAHLIAHISRSWRLRPNVAPAVKTGPRFLTAEVQLWQGATGGSVSHIPRDAVYPYSFDKLGRSKGPWAPNVVLVHSGRTRSADVPRRRQGPHRSHRLLTMV